MTLDDNLDDLATRIEKTIAETESLLEQQPVYPPRPGKYKPSSAAEQANGVIPVAELANND